MNDKKNSLLTDIDFSEFGNFLGSGSGILSLMEDIDSALSQPGKKHLLGGGNPSRIPKCEQIFRDAMISILNNGSQFEMLTGNYDGAKGNSEFIALLTTFFRDKCGWDVQSDNICITNGSQSSFQSLFNLFSGHWSDGSTKKILLPLAPEYIGYSDLGLGKEIFKAFKPKISRINDYEFKYNIDFDALSITNDIGAITVSRPTNPTGNVITNDELIMLYELSIEHGIPLILDCAYGAPFPNIIFNKTEGFWKENIILCLSLSKLGLPGLRTGIVLGPKSVIQNITAANAIYSLAPGSTGPALGSVLLQNNSILDMSNNIIKPYYQSRVSHALEIIRNQLSKYPYRVHVPEGAIFLWLWFEGLPITSAELYRRLKERDVLIIAGEHFFPGLKDPWKHKYECIRISYAQDPLSVEHGIKVIAEEIEKAFGSN